ncbi:helix-turn-helix transcriptional regulator [Paenibacillus prosopidis]|uniref:Putative DNA-binding transcriptional regulator YafY n=1 Tax=Paenibacillus prosopidis TaxID=630520 RepID=A0A368VTJ1_9BACL|nr:YafY family protein [Paenibacillus prosopidis]RCW44371.1 putative DNA-binding transcriptional regulator YafY [Paenibacillus prosopidis]
MRAGRLIAIVLLMQNNGKMTSKALAEKLEVSERTIIRDMESLSEAGVPVYAERGLHGGWKLSEGYRTNLTGIHAEELASLLMSNHPDLLGDLGIQKHFDAAFQKLLAASPAEVRLSAAAARQKIHIDGAGWHATNESVPCLSIVQEAVWEERILRISYQRDNGVLDRIVHPLGLVAKRNVWYFVAEVEGELRTYRISRLLEAEQLEDSFVRPPGFDLASYWEQSTEEFKQRLPRYPAKVKVLESLISRLSKERYIKIGHREEPAKNGWIEVEIEFETLESACELVLSFGPRIEVLAPAELRTRVMAEVKAMSMLYAPL